MVKKLFVGNLPFSTTENDLNDLFAQHGAVHSVKLINDRETGRPRGFGFVEMDGDAALAAMQALDGRDMGGRSMRVNEAQERTQNSRMSGGRGERR
ncbi:MAG: RNA-binding protein [Magnetococcales bacterium]|nr:RNA-binding protein [Magnetococcales bacterium]